MTGTETCRTNPGGHVLSASAGLSGAQHRCTMNILSGFPGYTAGHSYVSMTQTVDDSEFAFSIYSNLQKPDVRRNRNVCNENKAVPGDGKAVYLLQILPLSLYCSLVSQ